MTSTKSGARLLKAATAAALGLGAVAAPAAPLGDAAAKAACEAAYGAGASTEVLSACQWDMRKIRAGAAAQAGITGRGVRVGIIDSGVDLTHPDLAPNLDVLNSCSFINAGTPTAHPQEIANGDCTNKAAVQDLQGHGTHVATTVAAPMNGIGITGVAPQATIVALKACTISGYCFADSVAAALRRAGDLRLDVVNMSLFADPYLFYCKSAVEQRAILAELESAARYAQSRGVLLVASAGNESHDLSHPTTDDISPDWPPGSEVEREVRNNCRVAPAELPGVVTVSALGVQTLAGYSSVGQTVNVAAPGGDASQFAGYGRGRILAGWTSTDLSGGWDFYAATGRAIESAGGRYVWISGTSMAAPHVTGVAALIKERHPTWGPGAIAAAIGRTAMPMACPTDWPATDPRQCQGALGQTSFFGKGVVNAGAAAD
jgi:subtilisin family serine protease